ncbi:Type 1 glutamine amidotransferase-like domain-containing protein [Candidatus Gottesmanbacteria bacterium]|nr:Type 1 glutamine amidotransferase-like domain-containing protein [Candidatus Gottesmanbacteria bacterium]
MQRLFLTSSGSAVAQDISKKIGKKSRGMRLAFIDTATEVEEGDKGWLRDDRAALVSVGFDLFDYTLTGKISRHLHDDLAGVDVVFLEGGNQFYLLQQIQQSGFAPVIRALINKGVIYIGSSAGSQVAGPDLYPTYRPDHVKKAPLLKGYQGLGLVNFVVFPHWGSKSFKDLYLNFRMMHAYTTKHKIILLTDRQYIRVEGEMYRIEDVKR